MLYNIQMKLKKYFYIRLRYVLVSLMILFVTILICSFLQLYIKSVVYTIMFFILAVAIISRVTEGFLYGTTSSLLSVIAVNYLFTYPYQAFNFSIASYPITFLSMFIVSIIICTMTTQIKEQEKIRLAAETEKMKSNLLRAISHDLRTPLTSILGSTSAILENYDKLSKEERASLLSEVQEDAEWLIRMVENLLSITRINGKAANIKKSPEIAEEIIEEAVTKFKKRYNYENIKIEIPEQILFVPMDAMLIEQVIINLLENSIKHAKTSSYIRLRAYTYENNAIFEIEDNGVGIPKHQISHLFDGLITTTTGHKADSSRDMGIGLSVCMSLIKAHNGHMEAHNLDTGGVVFKFTLPLKEENNE